MQHNCKNVNSKRAKDKGYARRELAAYQNKGRTPPWKRKRKCYGRDLEYGGNRHWAGDQELGWIINETAKRAAPVMTSNQSIMPERTKSTTNECFVSGATGYFFPVVLLYQSNSALNNF